MKLPTLTATGVDFNPATDGEHWTRDDYHWRVTLTYQGRRMSLRFHQGAAHTKPPTVSDVLDCLFSDASAGDTFADFCSNFGCGEDSRKAEKTWKACRSLGIRLRKVLGADFDAIENHIRKMQEA